MEIKQGDKVRVSKDAPEMYLRGQGYFFIEDDCIVDMVEDDNAVITNGSRIIAIPTKYLVKVDAEAKERKIKLGDMVRIKNLHEPFCLDAGRHLEITNIPPHAVSQKEWKVISVEARRDCAGHIYTLNHDDSFIYNIPEDCVELVEPTEQTEAENQAFALGERVVTPYGYGVIGKDFKGNATVILERGECCGIDKAIKPIADNPTFDWDAYTADLAKELAIAYGKRGKSPLDAVAAAKEITKRLKQK